MGNQPIERCAYTTCILGHALSLTACDQSSPSSKHAVSATKGPKRQPNI
jgi:hypothetical protein